MNIKRAHFLSMLALLAKPPARSMDFVQKAAATGLKEAMAWCSNNPKAAIAVASALGGAVGILSYCSENALRSLVGKPKCYMPNQKKQVSPDLVKYAHDEASIPISPKSLNALLQEKKERMEQAKRSYNAQLSLGNRLYKWAKNRVFHKEAKPAVQERFEEYKKLKASLPWFTYGTSIEGRYFLPAEIVLHIARYTGYKKEFYVSPKEIITELIPYCPSLWRPNTNKRCIVEDKPVISGSRYDSTGTCRFSYCCRFDQFIDQILQLDDYHTQLLNRRYQFGQERIVKKWRILQRNANTSILATAIGWRCHFNLEKFSNCGKITILNFFI